jgi:hypothetical protein
MNPQIHECNKCAGTWTLDMEEIIEVSDVRWEYEDQLPKMERAMFDSIFPASRIISGVRMYPFVEDSAGNRVWISFLPNADVLAPAGEKTSTTKTDV